MALPPVPSRRGLWTARIRWLGLLALAGCAEATPTVPDLPQRLADTGLYADFEGGRLGPDVLAYEPQYPLWTDGAAKRRWLRLPPGTWIDASDPDAWQFPVGTKLWKEFALGRAIETRYMERLPDGTWRYATYAWSTDGRDALLTPEAGVPVAVRHADGVPYTIPSVADCRACHDGRATPVLGVSALQLSPDRDPLAPHAQPPAPEAIDLVGLAARGLVRHLRSDAAGATAPRIAATSERERAVFGYLHANCSMCHGASSVNAGLGLDLRARHVTAGGLLESAARTTAIAQPSRFRVPGVATAVTRIEPGDPVASVLLQRLASRLPAVQMPPLGTHRPDTEARELIEAWIREDLAAGNVNPSPKGLLAQEN